MAAAFCLILSACAGPGGDKSPSASKTSAYLTILDTEPALADPQRISEKYTVVLNVFDRLAEEKEEDGRNRMVPSLADSWEVSGDGLVYTFRLHPGVTFSNGAALTAEDVEFTFHRLISHPFPSGKPEPGPGHEHPGGRSTARKKDRQVSGI